MVPYCAASPGTAYHHAIEGLRVSRWLASRGGAWLTAVLLVAAAGALWAMAAILTRELMPWMALPMAAAAVFATRSLQLRARWARGLVAALLTTGGVFYALAFATTERLSRMLGRSFVETAITAGPEMIAALAWSRLSAFGLAVVALGPLVAMLWAFQRGAGRGDVPPG